MQGRIFIAALLVTALLVTALLAPVARSQEMPEVARGLMEDADRAGNASSG